MRFEDKEYVSIFFVLSRPVYSINVNGDLKTPCSVVDRAKDYVVSVAEAAMANLPLAFEALTEFKLEYKGSDLASLRTKGGAP